MALDGITTAALAAELNQALAGARISKIIQPESDALLLTLKAPSRQYRLLMSASASLPLVYLTENNRTAPAQAPNFCMLLRKHIGGGRIISITQPSLERILRFEIEHLDEMGDLCRKFLILELMGKHSNLIFCTQDDQIIDSIKHISAQMSSVREVLPGRPYFIPDTQKKADPLCTNREEFAAVFTKPMPLSKAVYTSYTGLSPVIAQELLYRCGMDPDRSAASIPEEWQEHVWNQFNLMMNEVKDHEFRPQIILNEKDEPVEFAPLDLTIYHDLHTEYHETISEVLEQYYAMRDKVTRIRQKSSDLRHIVSTAIERVSRKLDLQQRQMKDTQKKDQYRLYGELLHTYGYGIEEGAKSTTATDYYSGEEVTIPLDPSLSASENAKRYYERFAKLKRTALALEEQIALTQSDLDQLESIRTFLDMALDENDLVQVREELAEAGYIRRKTTARKVKILSKPYHYRTEDGFDIYVGKNNLQNDELTFRFASGSDWWFHAKGAPGSHVILKNDGREIPDHAFEDAARLAAYYSANRSSGRTEIDYVQRREVKKPNGAKPGFVVYYTNYSMMIDTDISRLVQVSD